MHYELPSDLPDNERFEVLRKELRKLPLATRPHLFDVLSYSQFAGSSDRPKPRLVSDMTQYDTRAVGIDEQESAKLLQQSKLIVSLPDGTGYIHPDYVEVVRMADVYAKKIAFAYREWDDEVVDRLLDL